MSSLRPLLLFLCLVVLLPQSATASSAPPTGADDTAPFSVRFGETTVSHRVMAVLTRPDETVRLSVVSGPSEMSYDVDGGDHQVESLDNGSWRVRPPDTPGLYPLTVTAPDGDASIRLQVFVLQPWNPDQETLEDYYIGKYEKEPRDDNPRYEPPEGFVRVTDDNRDARISPHFRLDQFLCKQTEDTPQYALVQPRLLRTLEAILHAVNERGHNVSTLQVMSGFRTPYYNRSIGNRTEYSRHLYGDAADIFVDANEDGKMDDLTGDGRVTRADAEQLAQWIEEVPTEGEDSFVGGLSVYGPASHRGPFVHVDLRGEKEKW
ncbi:MAG: D-Ala-D-Ala carboxypeptidase family metallohydrolase [Salinivenus sp.]